MTFARLYHWSASTLYKQASVVKNEKCRERAGVTMAFDMYLDGERAFIDHHEENLFYLIKEDENYPQLNWIWQQFYDGPRIEPHIANDLVHELIRLKAQIAHDDSQKAIDHLIDRLLPFLSKSYKNKQAILCASD